MANSAYPMHAQERASVRYVLKRKVASVGMGTAARDCQGRREAARSCSGLSHPATRVQGPTLVLGLIGAGVRGASWPPCPFLACASRNTPLRELAIFVRLATLLLRQTSEPSAPRRHSPVS